MATEQILVDLVNRAIQDLTLEDKLHDLDVEQRYREILDLRNDQIGSLNRGFVVCLSNKPYAYNNVFIIRRFSFTENWVINMQENDIKRLSTNTSSPYPLKVHFLISTCNSSLVYSNICKVLASISNDIRMTNGSFKLDVANPMVLLRDVFLFAAIHSGGKLIIDSSEGIQFNELQRNVTPTPNNTFMPDTCFPIPAVQRNA